MKAYERLLNYVKIHTTSDEDSTTVPSTARQFDLAKILVEELKGLGVVDAHAMFTAQSQLHQATRIKRLLVSLLTWTQRQISQVKMLIQLL